MIGELAHQSALVPLAVALVFWRRLPRAWRFLAVAWTLSWVGDSMAYSVGDPWRPSYLWLPAQIAIVLVAFLSDRMARFVAVAGVALLAVTSVQATWPGPEWITTLAGSLAILAVVDGVLSWPVIIYFGLGSLAYLLWLTGADEMFYVYQVCRVVAYALYVGILLHKRREMLTWPS